MAAFTRIFRFSSTGRSQLPRTIFPVAHSSKNIFLGLSQPNYLDSLRLTGGRIYLRQHLALSFEFLFLKIFCLEKFLLFQLQPGCRVNSFVNLKKK